MKHLKKYKLEVLIRINEDDQYLTLDNGGIPFILNNRSDVFQVYKDHLSFPDVKKHFDGIDKN